MFDTLGAFDRFELYSALVVDSASAPVAQLLARVANLDPGVNAQELADLYRLVELNHGAKP